MEKSFEEEMKTKKDPELTLRDRAKIGLGVLYARAMQCSSYAPVTDSYFKIVCEYIQTLESIKKAVREAKD